ncbi:transport between ER and Golgi ATPase protein [Pleurotus ostreatus]|uniref:Vesicular-fusion protein SEC18 n=1 Tax=Pleurotus ostreatus TaxID=5322 RepID=A0A8H6ZV52_PLEOS|nr:transport between ER and Golgi ATPase protein [Pleurotus ostreatus]KAF7432705.1 transport between ER and Golgi ATPase protein [Pleurotus ostreatus]KAJ8698765.1 transport between ER and Golgi ATPase protein [Pleurotus ostreatus]
MSFFGRSNNPPPPPQQYNRIPDRGLDNSLPSGPRSGMRQSPSRSTQGSAAMSGYNDPSGALFERRGIDRRPPSGGPPVSRQGGNSQFEVKSCPSDVLALTNCLVVYPSDFSQGQHVLVKGQFPITVRHDDTGMLKPGFIGASALQRQWMGLSVGDFITVEPLPPSPHPLAPSYLQSIDLEMGFMRRGHEIAETFSADEMAKNFLRAFNDIVFAIDEIFVFEYHGQNLKCVVKAISTVELADEQRKGIPSSNQRRNLDAGILMDKTDVTVMKAGDSAIKIKSSAKKAPPNAILAPNFKFEDMGIGGLDTEFAEIFRRAFASRVFPPALVEKLGITHVKGLLLHGPPGTGKTLIARQIGKMLNAREPKIVNGPEILSKYVGASEENIRKLFADAEKESKEKGDESGLHIIIFDELDAIFKQRGSTNNGTGVGDTVVNQLLSKMDGVDQLNNILIIGMTNRKDMIDEALLRPGRLEVHMEISLPDEHGRRQILMIHTNQMRRNGVMDTDVNLDELAAMTKNFSGAEISGLIKSATSFAFQRHVKVGTMAGISDDVENLRVKRQDFLAALEEVHPAFGVSEEELEQVIQNGIIHFDPTIDEILHSGHLFVEQVRSSTSTFASILLHGPTGSGKTALAACIAQRSEFPFIKLISPDAMVGFGESQKVAAITKVFGDSYKSPLSVIVVDNIERLLDYAPIGPRYSNAALQALSVLCAKRPPKGRRLLVIATTSKRALLNELDLFDIFTADLYVPPISRLSALAHVLEELQLFQSSNEQHQALGKLRQAGFADEDTSSKMHVGIKKLLSTIEMARQEPENVVDRLTGALLGIGM